MATFVIAHGAWSAGWVWKKMRPLMRAAGHELFTPSYTGIGERSHLAHPGIDLDTHITDVLNLLHFEDLKDIILLGHSYGGMVATGVADRAPDRIRQVIYLDAFVPRDGQSALSLFPEAARARTLEAVRTQGSEQGSAQGSTQGEGWLVPANPLPGDTDPQDFDWATPRRVMQPVKTFVQPLALTGAGARLPKAYIYCTRFGPGDVFRQFADRARAEPGWKYHEMDASHNPHITVPQALMAILQSLV
jgi:pimeloyl-ACP methyl ester carboxylesterase